MVCCVLYLASALVLRDHWFVYVLSGGIRHDRPADAGRRGPVWEIAAPAALLVGLALMGIHVERAFPRSKALSRAGVFWAGLLPVGPGAVGRRPAFGVGAQLAGDWLYRPLF